MEILLNPNIAYFLLVVGFMILLLAIITPGTGLLEVSAFILLAVAGYSVFKIGFNLWGLLILVIALFPFIYATRKPGRLWALFISLLAIIIGSIYIFPSQGLVPMVNPIVAAVLSIICMGFVWFVIGKAMKAHTAHPLHDLGALIGQVGEAKTDIHETGSIQLAGELWSARAAQKIRRGDWARVVSRDGFVLEVEPAPTPEK